jgi:nucleotide-binding universal stress UspA family protein
MLRGEFARPQPDDPVQEFRMYKRILVPFDGSAPSRAGLHEAIGLAAGTDSALVVLHVVSELPLLMGGAEAYINYGEMAELLMETGRELVQEAARSALADGVSCETQVVDGGPTPVCDVILEQIAAQRCDLVVMGTHGRRGLKRLTLGSDAELVVRRASVPVLLVKAPETAK